MGKGYLGVLLEFGAEAIYFFSSSIIPYFGRECFPWGALGTGAWDSVFALCLLDFRLTASLTSVAVAPNSEAMVASSDVQAPTVSGALGSSAGMDGKPFASHSSRLAWPWGSWGQAAVSTVAKPVELIGSNGVGSVTHRLRFMPRLSSQQ